MTAPRVWRDRNSAEACEDPFLWRDLAHGVLHLLCHHNQPGTTQPAGLHAYSTDGGGSFSKPVPAFGTAVSYTNGTTVDLYRRERPWLVFDRRADGSGAPTHLLTSALLNKGDGFSWTFVQPLDSLSRAYSS